MARITVEDCLKQINNRFEMVVTAARRARSLMLDGSQPAVDENNDKPTVVALREIAAGHIHENTNAELEAASEALANLEKEAQTAEDSPQETVEIEAETVAQTEIDEASLALLAEAIADNVETDEPKPSEDADEKPAQTEEE